MIFSCESSYFTHSTFACSASLRELLLINHKTTQDTKTTTDTRKTKAKMRMNAWKKGRNKGPGQDYENRKKVRRGHGDEKPKSVPSIRDKNRANLHLKFAEKRIGVAGLVLATDRYRSTNLIIGSTTSALGGMIGSLLTGLAA